MGRFIEASALFALLLSACPAASPEGDAGDAGERCGDGTEGAACFVSGPGGSDECGAGLHCYNPSLDEGGGCFGVCRAEGDECVEAADCPGEPGEVWCQHGHCEPVCC